MSKRLHVWRDWKLWFPLSYFCRSLARLTHTTFRKCVLLTIVIVLGGGGGGGIHYDDAIISAMASQITSLPTVYSTFYSGANKKIKAPRHWPLCGEFIRDRLRVFIIDFCYVWSIQIVEAKSTNTMAADPPTLGIQYVSWWLWKISYF